jgi:undecaprenyl-diphosphatase
MTGATLVAVLSAGLAFREVRLYVPLTYNLAISIHRIRLGKLIELGWVRK